MLEGAPGRWDPQEGEFDDAVLESRQLPPCGQQNPEDFCISASCAIDGYGYCPYPDQNCCRWGPQ